MNILLWVVQILLALVFLFSGGIKLVFPIEVLREMGSPNQIILPGWFIKFIGVCEVLGAIGLVAPGVFRTKQYLTAVAAAGLAIIMVGAVVITAMGDGVAMSIPPFVVLVLCVFVAYGRSKLRPASHQERSFESY